MNTLITFHHQQPISITKPSLFDQKTQPFHHPTTLNNHLPLSKTSCKLHAQAKGFGKTSTQKKNNAPKSGSTPEEEDEDDKIPTIVFDRMIRRIVTSVGVPMATGVVLLKLFDALKEKQLWDVPLWVTFITTFVFFGSSVLGVAYGSLSTSWDAEKSGSVLGFEEAKQNWDEMWKEDEKNKD
ncbi:hypothetical protein SOVF_076950 [Spinacia oleracea]|uniref:Uncharacterized protein PAM68-like n=1 Tax=Spinacia oleracea TaxID=3562 RepID=A0A9R0JRQ7_SPIOL|nr:uncharacterized protein PAM68-like [Spinacia oleracea]KNA17799.1 hypothetical protein SOVF_076950 [Spinacia oleracea]